MIWTRFGLVYLTHVIEFKVGYFAAYVRKRKKETIQKSKHQLKINLDA